MEDFILLFGILDLISFAFTAFGIPLSGYAFGNKDVNKISDNTWRISLSIAFVPVINIFTGLFGIVSISYAIARFCINVALGDD